ncbi:MAG: phytase [Bacteroidota bacterium]
MKFHHLLLSLLTLFFFGCKNTPKQVSEVSRELELARQEARDDSLELIAAYERQSKIELSVSPTYETDDIASDNVSDAADDPAIWVHPSAPEKSIIIGSNKTGGIHLYNLTGKEIAYSPVGNVNNVDVIPDFKLGEESVILVGGSNRTDQSIDLLTLDPETAELVDISANALKVNPEEIDDIYGFCFYQEKESEKSYVFINGKNGRMQQFELLVNEKKKVEVEKVRDVIFDSQVEGMVVDAQYGNLYVGEEGEGIWKLSAKADGGSTKSLISMSGEDNPAISYDIEGLAIYQKGDRGYLLASSQGNFSYAVFDRLGENAYIGSFIIEENEVLDGVEETDGIEVSHFPLGEEFPEGIFVAQDGFNYEGDSLKPQNFKIVDWREIEKKLIKGESKLDVENK